jgi:Cu/Ag efflux protein CusF
MKRWIAFSLVAVGVMAMMAWAQQSQVAPSAPKTASKAVRYVVGKVTAISDTSLTIERSVKGKTETMEFTLTKPLSGIAQGDEVRVSYKTEDGKNVAIAVKKVGAKKASTSTQQ